MRFLVLVLIFLVGCRENGEWKLVLGNQEEVKWIAPHAIRGNCVDYYRLKDFRSDSSDYILVPPESAEKSNLYGRSVYMVRYLDGKREVFRICSKDESNKAYYDYLEHKYTRR